MFDYEGLWRTLLNRDYPKAGADYDKYFKEHWMLTHPQTSDYDRYVEQYWIRHVPVYVTRWYNTEYEDSPIYNYEGTLGRSPRFLTVQEAIQYLWDRDLSKRGIIKKYYQLKPQLSRLVKVFWHHLIIDICNSEDPLGKLAEHRAMLQLRKDDSVENFMYDEDIDERECLDLLEDYLAEFEKYKEVVWQILERDGEIYKKTGDCGWNIWKILKSRGIIEREFDQE